MEVLVKDWERSTPQSVDMATLKTSQNTSYSHVLTVH